MRILFFLLMWGYANGCSFVHSHQYAESAIRINQLGYLTSGKKQAVVVSPTTNSFHLKNMEGGIVYSGNLLQTKYWDKSAEEVSIADFSNFSTPGRYQIVNGNTNTPYFEIDEKPFVDLAKASIKSFYFNRASMALDQKYSGKYHRELAHPDTTVVVHTSGASEQRPEGYKISTPYGWYDAGDYNKYVVNSGITTYTLIIAYLHSKPLFDTLDLNIPESENERPDILDEILWNVRWMESMQDPNDGGVYHKTTTANFEQFIKPQEATNQRFVVAKGTAATLNFAAVLAKVAVVLRDNDPEYARILSEKAEKAWSWALKNPNMVYKNPVSVSGGYPAISTGEYGDRVFQDEFLWASVELFLATGEKAYLEHIKLDNDQSFRVPNWNSVETLGLISLSSAGSQIPEIIKKRASDKLLTLSEELISIWREAPYKITLNDFRWGSNSDILNQGMVLINAYRNFGNTEFFEAALSSLDYVLGRNAVGYCFVTGMGHVSPMNPHHRLSATDSVAEPVPGMLVGGPNPHQVDQDCGRDQYETLLPATCYIDRECSYSTNEVAINWNAPLVYLSSSLQFIYLEEFSKVN